MKFPLSWLKEYLDTPASLEEITQKLTAIGLEVEDIHDPAKMLQGFVVGHVLSAEKHPDADKLQCLLVDTGTEKLKVVCGAPNARAGMKGVFAPAGSYIPGSDITLRKSLIRGQESNGMMCSERELLLSEEHKGIIELSESCVTGSPAADALGQNDPVIEINLTPNRGDCAGIYGIARDLAAAGLGKLKPLTATPVTGKFKNPVNVSIADEKACPLFIGRLIRDVKNGPSPQWLQDRLKAVGLRPISTLVDITNYFCIGLNRPLHVFDADKIKGNIQVRLSKKGEKLEALNDSTYELADGMIAVCDDSGVLGLGGIIGGVFSSVTETTMNVYLEAAYFDPARIMKTGQSLLISSDARYRFERGIDPAFTAAGAELATRMILDLCGGEASETVATGNVPESGRKIGYRPERLQTLGGLDLSVPEQKEILLALGFIPVVAEGGWSVTTPSWRHDIHGEADIVEEILRIAGYDKIAPVPVRPAAGEKRTGMNLQSRRAITARHALAARGLHESITWSFMPEESADLFGMASNQNKAALTLANPISVEMGVMRPSILPNLIAAAGRNADRGAPDACLFEIGNIYQSPEVAGQLLTATGLRTGNAVPRHWAEKSRAVDVYDVKADALAVLETCGMNLAGLQVTRDAPEWYHPGRSGTLRQGNAVFAYFGALHPAVLAALKREEACAGFEVFLQAIPAPKKKGTKKELLKPSLFQPLGRDFAFVLDETVEAEKLVRAIRGAERNLITDVQIFDVYQGKGVAPGKKSVAIGVTLQPADKTLTDAEIAALCQKIVEAVGKQTGGVLRG